MTVSAHDVARALRARLPDIGATALQKLLYYCQGHHLAATGGPLFSESISAWDNGPVVGQLWYAEENGEPPPASADMTEGQLNTVGYVCSRYGALTAHDLVTMTHGEPPWQRANERRPPSGRVRIELPWLRDFFDSEGAGPTAEDTGSRVSAGTVQVLLARGEERRDQPAELDSINGILDRIRRLSA